MKPSVAGPAGYVDPFIAVNWPGNGLCGPYLPFSLVRLGPDCRRQVDTTGYATGHPIQWFSHTHVSGTGGNGRYGNIGLAPFAGSEWGCPADQIPAKEEAAVGYYAVTLNPARIRAELTSTPRVGVHRYTFPTGQQANVLVDVGAVIQVRDAEPIRGTGGSTGGFVECVSDTEVIGRGDYRGGWGHNFPYSVYFAARFDTPAQGKLVGNRDGLQAGVAADGPDTRAVLSFGKKRTIGVRVGISFISVAKARAALEREAGTKDFDTIRDEAVAVWNQAFSRFSLKGGTATQKKMFYTMLYRLLCMPTDLGVDDENAFWSSGVRSYQDFYCLWDSVRNANSFFGLFDPEREVAFLNSLLDVADHIGWIPDAWIAGHSAQVQGGSSADVLFCEAALKGFPGIDYEKALSRMRRNAEQESPNPQLYGRYVNDYQTLGYVSTNVNQGASRHVEYAYQDWCIGKLAAKLGQDDVARSYQASSKKIWNLWRKDLKSIAPRQPSGVWAEGFDPMFIRPDCWADPHFYEGSGYAWTLNVHHDIPGLIARLGGPAAFMKHLDLFCQPEMVHPWKEIVLHIPYLYIYAGRPDRTAERVQEQLRKHYRPTRDGLDDNEDMGCQSSFYLCSSIGVYPVMGQDLYLLTTPSFSRMEIELGSSGKKLVIEAPGAGARKPYIVKATLNGKPLNRAWLRHHEIKDGAVLRFELSAKPGTWGRNRPPSASQS